MIVPTVTRLAEFAPAARGRATAVLAADGAFRADGVYVVLPAIPVKLLERGFRIAVLKLLVAEGAIGGRLSASMLTWRHSGFSVHNGVRVAARDTEGRRKLAQYMLRAPLSPEKAELNITPIVDRSGQVQAPDCCAPAGPSDFAAGLIRLFLSSAIFAGVENPQHKNIAHGQLVADLVVPNQDPPYLAWREFSQALAEPRARGNALRAGDELANGLRGGPPVDRLKELVEPYQVSRPSNPPPRRTTSVSKKSASSNPFRRGEVA